MDIEHPEGALGMVSIGSLLKPPGVVVNRLRGDPHEHRAHGWLEWDGALDLDAALLGIAFDGASTVRTGSRHGPDAVREALSYYTTYSSFERHDMHGLRVADIGDADVVVTDMAGTFERVRLIAHELISDGVVLVSIGGDHSITWPLLEGATQAHAGKRVGVIHFDAHHDLREAHFGAESSGVPFRKALEFPDNPVRGSDLVQIGLCEFANSAEHAAYAADMGITVIPALEVRQRGIGDVIDNALEIAGDGTDALYVSLDIDVIDQSQAPGTAAPNAAGLDARDLQEALRRLARDPRIIGLDIVEISPPFDTDNRTGNVGAQLVLNFLLGLAMSR